jgi:hypothetical protein
VESIKKPNQSAVPTKRKIPAGFQHSRRFATRCSEIDTVVKQQEGQKKLELMGRNFRLDWPVRHFNTTQKAQSTD